MLFQATQKTPVGELFLVSHEHILLAAGFHNFKELLARLDPIDLEREIKLVKKISIISELISDYFQGDLAALGGIKVRQPGGEFSQEVWKVLRKIPAGKSLSYAEVARRAGSTNAVRAAATACARNLIAPIIPCHRVIKTGGALGEYGYGSSVKTWLLKHEGAI